MTLRSKTKPAGDASVRSRGRAGGRRLTEMRRRAAARKLLKSLRKTVVIGDIVSPSGDVWDAER